MEMASGTKIKRTRTTEQEGEHHEDHISRLPDAILGEIVSLLGTKDGGRTQAVASRWRHIWSSAPLNLDLHHGDLPIWVWQISSILSSHRGPCRRFSVPSDYFMFDAHPAATLDGWLRCSALDGLQELHFSYGSTWHPYHQMQHVSRPPPLPPPPESVRRFSSTLRVASFGACAFPDEIVLHLPLLEQLSLVSVEISETSLYALLAGCPLLQSLMLTESIGFIKRIRIVSKTLRSIGVFFCWESTGYLDQLIIEDAPSLERFLFLGRRFHTKMVVSVISAPKLKILGQLQCLQGPTLKLGNSVLEGSSVVNSTTVLPSVKVVALAQTSLTLDNAIALMKCFPYLENLYIKISSADQYQWTKSTVTNAWRRKYQNLIGTFDIRLKKIVLSTYLGNRAHVNFATFFVLNAIVLESMVLKLDASKYRKKAWIKKQKTLLRIEERASKGAQFDFVQHFGGPMPYNQIWYEQTHDLSTADPFVGFD